MRIVDSVVNTKLANRAGAVRHKIEDKLAGYTTPGRCYRDDYKRSVRHGRRALNLNLRRGIFD